MVDDVSSRLIHSMLIMRVVRLTVCGVAESSTNDDSSVNSEGEHETVTFSC